MIGWGLSAAGLASVLLGWVAYLRDIRTHSVKVKPLGVLTLQIGGAFVGLAAIGLARHAGVIAMSSFAAFMALFFVWLYAQRNVPAGDLKVSVGAPMIDFEAVDDRGEPFDSRSLRGRRVLLKFFRGSW